LRVKADLAGEVNRVADADALRIGADGGGGVGGAQYLLGHDFPFIETAIKYRG
jgi:hypothetical protein